MSACPCGSKKEYESCCGIYHSGKADAPTAEALMRARYCAYAKNNIDFIESTHTSENRDAISVEETRKWAEESEWLGLEILATKDGKAGDDKGVVEFVATYNNGGLKQKHHETASFKKENGKWFFTEGRIHNETITRSGNKVGRNDPCPCGSGKKYKKCCGR